jgi:hypothetical protein
LLLLLLELQDAPALLEALDNYLRTRFRPGLRHEQNNTLAYNTVPLGISTATNFKKLRHKTVPVVD